MRARVRHELVRHPAAAGALAGVLRTVGARSIAQRVRAVTEPAAPALPHLPDHVTVEPPHDGVGSFCMAILGGQDQIARDIFLGGWHAFEYPMPDLFAGWLRRVGGGLVLDVGANTGFYSLLAVQSAPGIRVDAFEPFPPVAALLHQNLATNDFGARVSAFELAVSDESGEATLHVPFGDHGLVETSCSLDPESRHEFTRAIQVPVTTLDAHMANEPRPVVLVKIDVEALDHLVLRGARATLERHRPVVFFELLPQGHPEVLEQVRAESGYVAARIVPDGIVVDDVVPRRSRRLEPAVDPTRAARRVPSLRARSRLRRAIAIITRGR